MGAVTYHPDQPWCFSHRADPAAKRLADRHYSRQSPDSPQFVPPGSCLVLLARNGHAYWVTSAPFAEFTKHAWAGARVCSAFRSEGAGIASDMIRWAIAATWAYYGSRPDLGMVTFIDRDKVKPTMVHGNPVWGWTFMKAGFKPCGETQGGLLALQMVPEDMPMPRRAWPRSMLGTPLFDWVA